MTVRNNAPLLKDMIAAAMGQNDGQKIQWFAIIIQTEDGGAGFSSNVPIDGLRDFIDTMMNMGWSQIETQPRTEEELYGGDTEGDTEPPDIFFGDTYPGN